MNPAPGAPYRGRIAPSPTGYLHLGHARTFWMAQERCRERSGKLVLRNEDLDRDRCRAEYVHGMYEDLRWFGCRWDEGPDIGGACAPYDQSARLDLYRSAFEKLRARGFVYPCTCSRRDIMNALSAPHVGDEEPVYPGACRERGTPPAGVRVSWRFRVPDGEAIRFIDGNCGERVHVAGEDFGDFIVWRHDGLPSYQLAVTVDDAAMDITEVVRGADLLVSTARQLLLYRALGLPPPAFFHCELVTDEAGVRLAKRHDALSLKTLRERGADPAELRQSWSVIR